MGIQSEKSESKTLSKWPKIFGLFVFFLTPKTLLNISISEMVAISLYDLLDILNYKDLRSVRKWCKKKNLFVFQNGSNEFVSEIDFELAFYQSFIEHLKRIHEDDWERVFNLYKTGQIKAIETLSPIPEGHSQFMKYKAEGDITKKYLNKYHEQAKSTKEISH